MTKEEAVVYFKRHINLYCVTGICREAEEMAIKALEQKQKMGRWLAVENEDMKTVGYYCSECDLPLETEERTPFCPNCGKKMLEWSEKE